MTDDAHSVALDADSLPTDGEKPVFDAPWQARAFALAVTLTDDEFQWNDFQTRLVDEIQDNDSPSDDDSETIYYEQWLAALERLLVEEDVLSDGELTNRVAEFEAGDRDASEFVVGDHGHTHDHGHSHDHPH